MGFKQFLLEMQVKDGAPPPVFATAAPAMFEALIDVFAPLDVMIHIDDEQLRIARIDPVRVFGTQPLWCDEELTRDALTRCGPTLGTDVIAELYERLAGIAPTSFYVSAEGALFHRAAGTDAPAWYGRWRGSGLWELASVAFHWTKDPWRGLEMKCPLSGYPFTALRPLVSRLADGDPALAAENRALWLPHLSKVRAALGFDREEVEWGTTGDFDASDHAEIRKGWLPKLCAS